MTPPGRSLQRRLALVAQPCDAGQSRLFAANVGAVMTRLLRTLIPLGVMLAIAGCSAPPPPEPTYPPPPPKKQLDAKTQLESGRKY